MFLEEKPPQLFMFAGVDAHESQFRRRCIRVMNYGNQTPFCVCCVCVCVESKGRVHHISVLEIRWTQDVCGSCDCTLGFFLSRNGAYSFLMFGVMFFVVFGAYAQFFYFIYHTNLKNFFTVIASAETCLQMMLGRSVHASPLATPCSHGTPEAKTK